ncbi:hypothetical protein [Asticcacaulis sp. YBE204]|uniref:hypothetical protein n=1 Tax=Asticcacaulis sp. YBE204 TaxID=1282363 RepID=UPI0003C3C9F7|nr:hypothetical protein [Asticcacaulis sp. YBE204]ESQ79412.1 hypothetical protein AEYBE204_10420 [Asticcacaulis sp. YBE204]
MLLFAPAHTEGVTSRIYIVDANLIGKSGTGLWRPTPDDAQTANIALKKYLLGPKRPGAMTNAESWNDLFRQPIGEHLTDYVLQMAGVRKSSHGRFYETDGDGPKQILIAGVCKEEAADMKLDTYKTIVLVADGGKCFFDAVYDLTEDRITYFAIHGMA